MTVGARQAPATFSPKAIRWCHCLHDLIKSIASPFVLGSFFSAYFEFDTPALCGADNPLACSIKIRLTSWIASGFPCTECPERTIFSDATPSMCALMYFTTPSPASSSGPSLSTAMIECATTPAQSEWQLSSNKRITGSHIGNAGGNAANGAHVSPWVCKRHQFNIHLYETARQIHEP